MAQSFLLSGTESIDQKICSRFNIATVDQATYSRHKGEYADIRSLTEIICKDDPSIEADLTDALLQQGTIKTAALQNLREKVGAQNHRTQILGNLMLLYLLMSPALKARELHAAVWRQWLAEQALRSVRRPEQKKAFGHCEGLAALAALFDIG